MLSISESAAGTQDTVAILHSVEELDEVGDRVPNITELQPGEVVLDLGSGAGVDCLLAARKVGPEGRGSGGA